MRKYECVRVCIYIYYMYTRITYNIPLPVTKCADSSLVFVSPKHLKLVVSAGSWQISALGA